MSPLTIASTVFKLISLVGGAASESAPAANAGGSGSIQAERGDFASSLALRLAAAQGGGQSSAGSLDFLAPGGLADPISLAALNGKRHGLAANGRNASLFDPESAYRMMTGINTRDLAYKGQFAELSGMAGGVDEMRRAGGDLAASAVGGDAAAVKSALQSFVTKYNEWVGRYGGTVKPDGLLAGTQAAEVALYELRQSIQNPFNGAASGFGGLHDLGVVIDPVTHRATLDTVRLDAALARSPGGVAATLDDFGRHFSRSAELLASAGNFIPNRLDNLDRAIDFISANRASLQAEFGLGDAPRVNASLAQALAAYSAMARG